MKKLSILFTLVFAVAVAMAQNTMEVTQEGSMQTANINQIGAENHSILYQTGGTHNDATINILGGSLNTTASIQNGDQNFLILSLYGDGNIVSTNQIGSSNAINGQFHVSNLGEDGLPLSTANAGTAMLSQDGMGNVMVYNVFGAQNQAKLAQYGTDHYAYVFQNSKNSNAEVTQNTANNKIWLFQIVGDASMIAEQKGGELNEIWAEQYGQGMSARIIQDGNYNFIAGSENGFLSENADQAGYNCSYDITQTGDYNTLNITQRNGADALLFQTGTENFIDLVQGKNVGPDNKAIINQIGNGHVLNGIQY